MAMSDLLLGLLAAFAAAGFYSAGIALQAAEARRMPTEHGLRILLLRRLVRRPRWIGGIALDIVGWGLQTLALGLAPLTVVQPALAVGLVFLLAIGSRALGEAVGRREALWVIAVAAGVAGLGWAAPAHVARHDTGSTLALALALLAAAALVPFVVARTRGAGAPLVAIAPASRSPGTGWRRSSSRTTSPSARSRASCSGSAGWSARRLSARSARTPRCSAGR